MREVTLHSSPDSMGAPSVSPTPACRCRCSFSTWPKAWASIGSVVRIRELIPKTAVEC